MAMSYREALCAIGREGFSQLGRDEQVAAYQAVENQMALEQGRPRVEVAVDALPYGTHGVYRHQQRKMVLSQDLLENGADNGASLVKTVVHEGRHAYQHMACDGLIPHKNAAELGIWQANRENYISPYDDFLGYLSQPLEQSAREYSEGRCVALTAEQRLARAMEAQQAQSVEQGRYRAWSQAPAVERTRGREWGQATSMQGLQEGRQLDQAASERTQGCQWNPAAVAQRGQDCSWNLVAAAERTQGRELTSAAAQQDRQRMSLGAGQGAQERKNEQAASMSVW